MIYKDGKHCSGNISSPLVGKIYGFSTDFCPDFSELKLKCNFRKLNKEIKIQRHRHTAGRKAKHHKADIPSCSTDSSESPSSSGSTAAIYRVRKKKMPCTKSHALYTRDMEDVIMEEKPISPGGHVTHSSAARDFFMEVNVDKLKTECACSGHASLGNHFELRRDEEMFKPVMPTQNYYQNQLQRSRRALRYLPESVV